MLKHQQSVMAARAAAAAMAVMMLAGCASPDYKPRPPGALVGYTDLQLAANRYRVSFSGSSASTRDDVEVYLLRRAAEVTLQAGYTHFVLNRRDTETNARYVSDPYFYRRYYYGRYWDDPYWGGGPWPMYSTSAEVVMLKPDQAAGNPEAIDALNLLQRLAPQPQLPVASAGLPPRS